MKIFVIMALTTMGLLASAPLHAQEEKTYTVQGGKDTPAPAAQEDDPAKEIMEKYEMKVYYMVFLKSGPKRSQSKEEAAEIQKAHLRNIQRLAEEGKMAMAGPFTDGGEIRGIFVLAVDSMEEAQELCNTDPAVQAGRLSVEIHPWYAAKGSTLP